MKTKEELLKELQEIEETELKEKEIARKEQNYANFKKRSADYMIGKAHAGLDFINIKYSSERAEQLLPYTVYITGNSGTSFTGKAPVTHATKTYFRNVWDSDYTRNEYELYN